MLKEYCDYCRKEIDAFSIKGDYTGYLVGGYKDHKWTHQLTLCEKCRKRFVYLLENPGTFKEESDHLRFRNRLRLLFKMRLKEGN